MSGTTERGFSSSVRCVHAPLPLDAADVALVEGAVAWLNRTVQGADARPTLAIFDCNCVWVPIADRIERGSIQVNLAPGH